MYLLICYDVSTVSPGGARRLRRVAQLCENHGQRVQQSVFECDIGDAQWVALRAALLATFDADRDSLRFYRLGESPAARVEHHGTRPSIDFRGPLIA